MPPPCLRVTLLDLAGSCMGLRGKGYQGEEEEESLNKPTLEKSFFSGSQTTFSAILFARRKLDGNQEL